MVAGKVQTKAKVSKQAARERRRVEAAKALQKRRAKAKAAAEAKAVADKAAADAKAAAAKAAAAKQVAGTKAEPKPSPKSRYIPPHLRSRAKQNADSDSMPNSQTTESSGSMLPVARVKLMAATTTTLSLFITVSRVQGFVWQLELRERSDNVYAPAHGVELGHVLANAEAYKTSSAPISAGVTVDSIAYPSGRIPLKSGHYYQVRVMVARDSTPPNLEPESAIKRQHVEWQCCSHADTTFRVLTRKFTNIATTTTVDSSPPANFGRIS